MSTPVAALFDRHLGILRASPLKSASQYASEASQFESAFADFSTLISSTTDITRFTTTVDRAANLRYAQCVAAAKTLPTGSQAKAIAACQAALLTDKIAFIG